MYNIFQFQSYVADQQNEASQQSKEKTWYLRRQNFKNISHEKYVKKIQEFINQTTQHPVYYEDDHFDQWRNINKYRDTKQQSKFLGFKTFVHKPNKEMASLLSERERIEKQMLEQKSIELVQNQIIPAELKSRSLRSQGPLVNFGGFRQLNRRHYQPPLRFRSITDKQKFIQNHVPESKFQDEVFKSDFKRKSKIGRIKVYSVDQKFRSKPSLDQSIVKAASQEKMMASIDNDRQQEQYQNHPINRTLKFSKIIQELNGDKKYPIKRLHFKGVKEMNLGTTLYDLNKTRQEQLRSTTSELLKECQYDRSKHLQNITKNIHYQSFKKPPIL